MNPSFLTYIWKHSLLLIPHRNTNCGFALPALHACAGLWITPRRREDSVCFLVCVRQKQRGRAAREHSDGAISAEKSPLPVKCFYGRPYVAPSWLEWLYKKDFPRVSSNKAASQHFSLTACKDKGAISDWKMFERWRVAFSLSPLCRVAQHLAVNCSFNNMLVTCVTWMLLLPAWSDR